MSVSIEHEIYVFTLSFLSGIICSMIFDFFRTTRKRYKQNTAVIGLSDILFWMISCIICYSCIYITNNGELRMYEFAAIIIGSFIYFLMLHRIFNIIFVNFFRIIEIIFKILLTPARFLYKIIIYTSCRIIYFRKKISGGKK